MHRNRGARSKPGGEEISQVHREEGEGWDKDNCVDGRRKIPEDNQDTRPGAVSPKGASI